MALVQWFRQRQKGGHFFDEDPKRIEYLAHVPDWINQRERDRNVPEPRADCFFVGRKELLQSHEQARTVYVQLEIR